MADTKVDYLDEDEPIRNQNFVCISFLNPEDVIKNKDVFYFSKFVEKFSTDMNKLFDNLTEKFPDNKDIISSIKDNHNYVFDKKELDEQFKFFKNTNMDDIEKQFHTDNKFQTSVRGIKVRGVYDTVEQAKNRCEVLKKKDPYFHIYVAQVGCWLPYESQIATNVDNQEYTETELNTLMKHYKENKENKDMVFDNRRTDAIKSMQSIDSKEHTDITTSTSLSDVTDALSSAEDPWLSAKSKL